MEAKKIDIVEGDRAKFLELQKFESTFVMPGFGRDALAAGRVVQHVIEKSLTLESPLKLLSIKVSRGNLVIAGDCDPAKLKAAVVELQAEISEICRRSRAAQSTIAAESLPRSAEESSS